MRPTPVIGRGRGQNHRIRDVVINRDAYALLCHDCNIRGRKPLRFREAAAEAGVW